MATLSDYIPNAADAQGTSRVFPTAQEVALTSPPETYASAQYHYKPICDEILALIQKVGNFNLVQEVIATAPLTAIGSHTGTITIGITTPIATMYGGCGTDPTTLTAGLLLNSMTTIVGSDGQIPVGVTGSVPVFRSLSGDIANVSTTGVVTVTSTHLTVALPQNQGGTGTNISTNGYGLMLSDMHSIIGSAGQVATVATDGSVNFESVPSGNLLKYYLQTAASSDITTDMAMLSSPLTGAKLTESYTPGNGTHHLQNWITNAGVPGLLYLPAGTFDVHLHASYSGGGGASATLYAELWAASSTGTNILLLGTTESSAIGTSEAEYNLQFDNSTTTSLAATTRIMCRVWAITSGSATVQLYIGGTADAHIELPANSLDASNYVDLTSNQTISGTKTFAEVLCSTMLATTMTLNGAAPTAAAGINTLVLRDSTASAAFAEVACSTLLATNIVGSIHGVTDGSAATAGNVGEQIVANGTGSWLGFPAANTVFGDALFINLSAGDWNVSAVLGVNLNAAPLTAFEMGISTSTGTSFTNEREGDSSLYLDVPSGVAYTGGCIPAYRISLAAASAVFLKLKGNYTSGLPEYQGRISARRVR